MDGVVAWLADHEGFPPFLCHLRRPRGLVWSGSAEPDEFGDVVDHHAAGVLAQLAPASHEPVDELFAGVGDPDR